MKRFSFIIGKRIKLKHFSNLIFHRWTDAMETDIPSSLPDTIKTANQELYPSIYMILCVLASMPDLTVLE